MFHKSWNKIKIDKFTKICVEIELIDLSLEFILIFLEGVKNGHFNVLIDLWYLLFNLSDLGLTGEFFLKKLIYIV